MIIIIQESVRQKKKAKIESSVEFIVEMEWKVAEWALLAHFMVYSRALPSVYKGKHNAIDNNVCVVMCIAKFFQLHEF